MADPGGGGGVCDRDAYFQIGPNSFISLQFSAKKFAK